jgi:two-component system phosphate regulon sensor histidine kinase PhoR
MWLALVVFLAVVALVALHTTWQKRLRNLQVRLADQSRKVQALEEHQAEIYIKADAQQQALFNSMLEGFLLLDDQGRIQTVNKALERLLGMDGDMRGRTVSEALKLPPLTALVDRVAAEGQVLGFEITLPGPMPRQIEVNAAALYHGRRTSRSMVLVFHDLTRLKELENTRREFVANVSHELRTPLTLIKGYAETLLDGAVKDPEVASRFVQVIEKHADRLTFLIEDLLTISKLESGQVTLNLQKTSLRPLVKRVIDALTDKAEEKQMRLVNSVPEDMVVEADSDRLEQVFFNLVDNAVKYGRVQGAVEVSASSLFSHDQISVSDDGPGIPPEARERVFERFYRLDRARSRDQGGTGLGLSIVKHIVQSHGGEVWVQSGPERGAMFYFTLPQRKS